MRLSLHSVPGQVGFEAYLSQIGASQFDPPLRSDLGRYTSHVAENAIAQLRKLGCKVHRVLASAVAVHPIGNVPGYVVRDANGGSWPATHVILATGHQPPSLPAAFAKVDPARISFYTGDTAFANRIAPNDKVLVIGTGPGGIDVARHLLQEHGVAGPIHIRSRHGLLSAVQTPDPVAPELVREVGAILTGLERSGVSPTLELLGAKLLPLLQRASPGWNFQEFVERATSVDPLVQLNQDIAEAAEGGPAWRMVVEAVGSHATRIWKWLGPVQQERFMTEQNGQFQRLYYTKRHAMLAGSARWLADRLAEGSVTVGSTSAGLPAYDKIVIATGPEYRISKTTNPVIRQMLDSGLARPCHAPSGELGGLWTQDCQLRTAPGIFAMGSVLRSEFYAVHGYPALDLHARIILAQLS